MKHNTYCVTLGVKTRQGAYFGRKNVQKESAPTLTLTRGEGMRGIC